MRIEDLLTVKNITLVMAVASALAVGSPAVAQTVRGQLQEEGIAYTPEQILRSQRPDAKDPRYVQAFRAVIESSTRREMSDQSKLDALLIKIYGQVSEPKMTLLRRNVRAIVDNDRYYDHLANMAVPMIQAKVPLAKVKEVINSSLLTIQVKGLRRVAEQDQMVFIAHTARFMGDLPLDVCKRVANAGMGEQEAIYLERKFLGSRSDEEFRVVADMYLRAIQAELSESPSVPEFTDAQKSSAQSIFDDGLLNRMYKRLSAADTSRVLNDLPKASSAEVCAFSLDVFRTMLEMPAPFRRWHLQAFIEDAVTE